MRFRSLIPAMLALAVTSASGQTPVRVVTTNSDPDGNACTLTAPPTILLYQSGSTFTTYICTSSTWSAVSAGTGTIGGTASTTDNAIVRTTGTGGVTVQGYTSNDPTISDAGAANFPGGITGALTGNADTATALAANGSNCSAGSAPLGVDASGAAETCTDYEEDLANSAGLAAALSDETGSGSVVFGTDATLDLGGGVLALPTATAVGTCSASEDGRVKTIEPTATAWPYVAQCVDIDGDGSYYWQKVSEESSAGFIPIEDEAVTTWTAQVGTDNDAVCVAEDVPYACCTGNGTGACTESATPVGVLSDGVLYGRGSADVGASDCQVLLKSSDGGESWTTVDDLGAEGGGGVLQSCIVGIYDLGDGEVLVQTTAELEKSTGWPTPSGWTEVLAPTSQDINALCTGGTTPLACCSGSGTGTCNAADRVGTFQPWAVDTFGTYVLVSEYVAGTDADDHWENSRYVKLSTDSGDNFSTVMDVGLEAAPGGGGQDPGEMVHIHGTAIDPWAIVGGSPRLWVSHHRSGGLPNNAQLYYSDDAGSTWNAIDIDPSTATVDGIQPTTLRAAKYGIVAGTDYEPEGWQRILRRSDPDKMQPEMLIELEWEGVSNGFTKRAWRDPRNGIVYDTYSQINTDGPSFVGASDGQSGNVIRYYMPDTSGSDDYTYWGAFVTWASGEDVLVLQIQDNGVWKYETMPVPARGSVPDRLFNKGNLYPPDTDADHRSVSVGIGSNATATDSVVLGYRASSTDTGNGSTVVIGFKAAATEPDSVVIGDLATQYDTGSANSVIVGDNTSGTFYSTIVGSGSTATGNYMTQIGGNIDTTGETNGVAVGYIADVTGNNATAVGRGSSAGLNSVAIGYAADGTTTDCTSIGHTASCDHGRSVALGNDTQTDATDQIAIGDRKITHQSSTGGNLDILFPDTASDRDYTLPDASGTVALTSDIPSSAYVAATHYTNGWANTGSNSPGDATVLRIFEMVVPHDVQFDTIGVYVAAAYSAATTCAVCIYGPANSSGVSSQIACSEGSGTATALNTTGIVELSVTEATVPAGLAWFGYTCDSTVGAIRSSNSTAAAGDAYLKGCWVQEGSSSASAMPATIDLSTESCISTDGPLPWVQLHDSVPSTF